MPYSSSIQLVNDANGTAYGFLADNGIVWQCQWDAEAQRWEQGAAVPGAQGGTALNAIYIDELWPNSSGGKGNAGIVLAYKVGQGNGAEIFASFGVWNSNGELEWSTPTALTNDQEEDQQFSLEAVGEDGGFGLVVRKQAVDNQANDASALITLNEDRTEVIKPSIQDLGFRTKPDADLYSSIFRISNTDNTYSLEAYTNADSQSSSNDWTTLTQLTSDPETLIPQAAPSNLPTFGQEELDRNTILSRTVASGNERLGSTMLMGSSDNDNDKQDFTWYKNDKDDNKPSQESFWTQSIQNWRLSLHDMQDAAERKKNKAEGIDPIPMVHNSLDVQIAGAYGSMTSGQPKVFTKGKITPAKGYTENRRFGKIDGLSNEDLKKKSTFGFNIAISGILNSSYIYSQSGSDRELTSYQANEGGSVGFEGELKLPFEGFYFEFKGGFSIGGQWNQTYMFAPTDDSEFKKAVGNAGLYTRDAAFSLEGVGLGATTALGYQYWKDRSSFSPKDSGFAPISYGLNAVVGTVNSLVLPASFAIRAATLSKDQGLKQTNNVSLNLMENFNARLSISKLDVGPEVSFVATEQRTYGESVYQWLINESVKINLVLPLGYTVPLFSETWTQKGKIEIDTPNPGSDIDPDSMVEDSSNDITNSLSDSISTNIAKSDTSLYASYSYTPGSEGPNPVLYLPNHGSITSSDQPSHTESSIPQGMLNALTGEMNLFTLTKSDTKYTEDSNTAIVFKYKGKNLKASQSNIEVDILGVTPDPSDTSQRAKAQVSTNADGELESIIITQSGEYVYLPASSKNDLQYLLQLDLAGAGLVDSTPDANGQLSWEPPVLLVSPAVVTASSPLITQPIQTVKKQTIKINSDDIQSQTSQSQYYPVYNPYVPAGAPVTSSPNPQNSNYYSYEGVPLSVSLVSGSINQKAINAELTARVDFSNGELVSFEPDEDIYFPLDSNGDSDSEPTVIVELKLAQFSQSWQAEDQLQDVTINTTPVLQRVAFNNVVDEKDYSPQQTIGSNSGNGIAGVFISDGINSQLPLYPEFKSLPLMNRVTYINRSNNSGSGQVVYLNAISGVPVYEGSVILADITGNGGDGFTTAFTPTAATLEGTSSDLRDSYTIVAWVEAVNPVIPAINSNGELDIQNYLDQLYGNQRINFRYADNSGDFIKENTAFIDDLYSPDNAYITDLKFAHAETLDSNGEPTVLNLLAWVEVPLPGHEAERQPSIKVATINVNAEYMTWSGLTSDSNGQSTISEISLGSNSEAVLIDDLAIASMPVVADDGTTKSVQLNPVLAFSRSVRKPYNQSVLNDDPIIYLDFSSLQPGISSINLGTGSPELTPTYASTIGIDYSTPSSPPNPQGTAVSNSDGTGVIISGLPTSNKVETNFENQFPVEDLFSTTDFIGSISSDGNDSILTVTQITAGTLSVGDVLTGPGVVSGSTITEVTTELVPGTVNGVYRVDKSQDIPSSSFKAYSENLAASITNIQITIDDTVLTVADSTKSLVIGDRLDGAGITAGTTVTSVNKDDNGNIVSYNVNHSQTVGTSESPASAMVFSGETSAPYSIEFWLKLPADYQSSNPNGAGLVAFGQPSSEAIGEAELPDNWLLESAFYVDLLTYEKAAALGNQAAYDAISSGAHSGTENFGWVWAVVAEGANTTAMNGTGGANIYSNALKLENLRAGVELEGVTDFLKFNQISIDQLTSDYGVAANVIANAPITQLEVAHFLDPDSGLPQSTLNNVAIDTNTAILNGGFIPFGQEDTVNTLFDELWEFQQKTGEAMVLFSNSPNGTNNQGGSLSQQTYSGLKLDFSLSSAPAVSLDGSGNIVFDVAEGYSIISEMPLSGVSEEKELQDEEWHYVVVSYLPHYNDIATDTNPDQQTPSSVGTASIYIDNELVAQDIVAGAYLPENINDELLILPLNDGAVIDNVAIYSKALTSLPLPSPSGTWELPSVDQAWDLIAKSGIDVDTQTSNPGAIIGGVTEHWLARNVNPSDAVVATHYSTFSPTEQGSLLGSWSEPSTLNPVLAAQATVPSAAQPGSLPDIWSVSLSNTLWEQPVWSTSQETTTTFNPSGQTLKSVSVPVSSGESYSLEAEQILIGNTTLADIQPLGSSGDLNYTFLTDSPNLQLLLPRDVAAQNDQVTVTLSFVDGMKATTSIPFSGNSAQFLESLTTGSSILGSAFAVSSNDPDSITKHNQALATAAVIEQAPLQLKYIDSGEVYRSQSSASSANQTAASTPAHSFGTSQTAGSFQTSSGNAYSGWLAIAQPHSTDAISDPGGRVWIQYTGDFSTDASGTRTASTDVATAPSTWLNALANSNFSPEHPNLPLLDSATYQSSSGGLLVLADATVGWGDNFGQVMLTADLNNDGADDLIISAPQANNGGRVYIIDGSWIQENLTTNQGLTTLNLANPGDYVTVLTPGTVKDMHDDSSLAAFGSSLAFDESSGTLYIGAPYYARQFDPTAKSGSLEALESLQPIGAIYEYNNGDNSALLPPKDTGIGGKVTVAGTDGSTQSTWWGSRYGSAIAFTSHSSGSYLAVSAPGTMAGMLYSGTEVAQETYEEGILNPKAKYGNGALINFIAPTPYDETTQQYNIDTSNGVNSFDKEKGKLTHGETTYMQNL